jgi:preprotein translocase subunit SecG
MYKKLIIVYTILIAIGVGIAVLLSIEKLGVTGVFNNPLGTLSEKDVVRATWQGR